jgi:hypothetical protein
MSEYTTMRECLLRDIHNLEDQRDFAMSEMKRLECERDKARNWVFRLRKQRAIARSFGEQMERERNEAREEARRATYDAAQETIKVSTVKSHWIEACRERDEARQAFDNAVKDIKEGRTVSLDKALTEEPPFSYKEAHDMQQKLVIRYVLENEKLEEKIEGLELKIKNNEQKTKI